MICTFAVRSSSLVPVLSAVTTCCGALTRSLPPNPASVLAAAVAVWAVAVVEFLRCAGDAVRVALPDPRCCSCCFALCGFVSGGACTTTAGNDCGAADSGAGPGLTGGALESCARERFANSIVMKGPAKMRVERRHNTAKRCDTPTIPPRAFELLARARTSDQSILKRNGANHPDAPRGSPSQSHHVRADGGLVDKHQPGRIKHTLLS
jgi:hypothetical protein